jgi:uncharacterized protein (TIGR02284 family)
VNNQTVRAVGLGADTTDAQGQTNSGIIAALNEAIAICRNGERGYLLAARSSEDDRLRDIFPRYARQRHQFADELTSAVMALGGRPERQGDLAGFVHRIWMRLRQFLSGHKSALLLEDCLIGDTAALTVYEDLLELRLPGDIQEIVERQYVAIRAARDRLDALRKSDGNGL